MTYQETLAWLFKQLPMYQRMGASAYKADLNNTLVLAEYLNHPEKTFKSIHVAGTNGKGSVSHMLASVLQEAGYKVGLYTSPHLKDFRERIKINGQPILEDDVVSFIKKHKLFFETHSLSFFEMTVGLAFDYFRQEQVDIAITEVGMGGRLDSTNIITPEVSVITNIGNDHAQFLGDTLEKIAIEKAGIIKAKVPVVIGETQSETEAVFRLIAKEKDTTITFADKMQLEHYTTDLKGNYQQKNLQTAVTVAQVLSKKGYFKVDKKAIKQGLLNVVKNTGLQGRWQILSEHPKIICDTAHNTEGLQYVIRQLLEESYNNLHIVLGVVADKKLDAILPLFPKNATYYFCTPDIPRGLDSKILHTAAKEHGLIGKSFDAVKNAFVEAKKNATERDLIFVGGSTFVVAEVL